MSKSVLSNSRVTEPIYSLFWRKLRHFPKNLAKGKQHSPEVSGPAAAALMSGGIGCLTMMITHHLGDTSKAREAIIWTIGSWIPGSKHPDPLYGNIGSYSGKETMLLVGWFVSWIILHQLWKNRSIKGQTLLFWTFILFIAATVMTWHPLFPYLPLM